MLVGSCVPIHAYRYLPDPKCHFYPSGLSLCLSVDHFCLWWLTCELHCSPLPWRLGSVYQLWKSHWADVQISPGGGVPPASSESSRTDSLCQTSAVQPVQGERQALGNLAKNKGISITPFRPTRGWLQWLWIQRITSRRWRKCWTTKELKKSSSPTSLPSIRRSSLENSPSWSKKAK